MKPAIVHRDVTPANDDAGDRDLKPDNEVLDVKGAAALLGVSEDTVYVEVAANHIPHRRLGKRIRFSRAALLRWLDAPTAKE